MHACMRLLMLCSFVSLGHAYVDQGPVIHPKPFLHFPPDGSRLPGPRFPGDQTPSRFGN